MKPTEFKDRYGKTLAKQVLKQFFQGNSQRLSDDIYHLSYSIDYNADTVIVVRDAALAAKILLENDSHINIICLGSYVSHVENKTFDDLNHKDLAKMKEGTKAILLFESTPEAEVTYELLSKAYPHLKFIKAPYGVPKKLRALDAETLLYIIKNTHGL
jgi:hypothetical protein